jgi:hypothetical protein
VIVLALLVVPTVQDPKLTLLGEIDSGRIPVPLAFNTSGLTDEPLASAIAPSSVPVVDGLKVTVKVQEAPEDKVTTHPEAL